MGQLDVRFHGICTHFYDMNASGPPLHRVILLRCDDPGVAPHRPLLSVPKDATVTRTGDAACECVEEVHVLGGGRHFRLNGVHLTMVAAQGKLRRGELWGCGVPKLTQLYPGLGPVARGKVKQEPPVDVAAWFDVTAGTLEPYVSLKGAVAVRLLADFAEERIRIEARCWNCPDVTWTFEVAGGSRVQLSNDCGTEGDVADFLLHYRIAENPPTDAPVLDHLPSCLPPGPPPWADRPPGWDPSLHNASLGCSNSDYP
jgi:hypothetical protein